MSAYERAVDCLESNCLSTVVLVRYRAAEHLRQHKRQTQADREVEQRVSSYVALHPEVHHLIY